ncbi:uncharacterized protein LOC110700481 isoform X1 [Chenopodium quinoa]|uniref:uncharacterized protein LOC110700481 isoform X1 n=1 Tax=Chenopodium quinoa TaxID=63459 RepID=UPI000B779857|nr:uncharacterized protein LOC110700481 isoform X1 [Chenopodium quinoa]
MDETQKMTALKKAYAEIILNTAKEAAARIMASERKSQQFHHDLTCTKEEALRLLLRQKQTMDAKINEAEMKSLNQQRRIEELEAQLQEAEDIVSNLRVELNEAHMKLEEVENNQTKNSPNTTERAHSEEATEQPDNGLSEAVSVAQTNSLDVSANGRNVSKNSLEEFGFSSDPVVPSIIMRSKKPELYRNGCTQRIRAYEGSLVNGHFSLSGESDDLKNEKAIREVKESDGMYMAPVVADTTFSSGKKPFDNQGVKHVDRGSSFVQELKSRCRGRKRAVRHRRRYASTLNTIPHLANETFSNLSNSQPCLTGDEHKETLPRSPSILQSSVSEMGILSEQVATARADETEVHAAVANEDTDIASSLELIKQQSGSGDCLNVSSSKQDLKSSSMLQALKPRCLGRKRAVRCSRRRDLSAFSVVPLLANGTLSSFSNSQPCLASSHDLHETNDGSDDIDKNTLSNSSSILQSSVSEISEHVPTTRGDDTEVCVDVVTEETDVAASLNLIKQQSGSGDCLNISSSKQDLEMSNSSSVNLNSTLLEAGNVFSSPPPKDRVLKYTFQRKRKKESVSGDYSSLHQESPLKRIMVKRQDGDLEPPKSSDTSESSRDSRRMAQVARQLISLSEKKWWK